MFGNRFHLNEESFSIVQEIGSHMPGGFFIYKAEEPGELLYANGAVLAFSDARTWKNSES